MQQTTFAFFEQKKPDLRHSNIASSPAILLSICSVGRQPPCSPQLSVDLAYFRRGSDASHLLAARAPHDELRSEDDVLREIAFALSVDLAN